MKNLNKKHTKWVVFLSLVVLVVLSYAFNVFDIKNKTVNQISQLTIPFSLIVNPKNIDQDIAPESIKTNDDLAKSKQHALNLLDSINQNYQETKELTFLSTDQEKSLLKKVNAKSHRYIYQMTLLNYGKDNYGRFITVSCNRYDDTKKIVSYRYRLYYKGDSIISAKYLTTTSNQYPPQFVLEQIKLGSDGLSQAQPFIQRLKTAIINSNLTATNATQPGDLNQIAINLGLDPDQSNDGLYRLAKHSNSRVSNIGIIGYQVTDKPRYTRIYIKQLSRDKSYYYTLTYNRNSKKFVSYKNGIISSDVTK